jgi:predicted  nucleic acid-binding Zn-ribbon protein|tara:strand:- start:1159 stop:1413 length:255 start_codon:yes stop_codon:yes gene_type:complete
VVEIYAAILGASIGVAGLSLSGFNKRQNEAHDAVVRLSVAVENIAEKLEDLHKDMKDDRERIYGKLELHENRLTMLEGKTSKFS